MKQSTFFLLLLMLITVKILNFTLDIREQLAVLVVHGVRDIHRAQCGIVEITFANRNHSWCIWHRYRLEIAEIPTEISPDTGKPRH